MSQEFKTVKEVADYLRDEGWKVGQSTVYKHVGEGRLRPDKDGVFTLKAVQRYARRDLATQETYRNVQDDKLRRKTQIAELALKSENAKLARIRREEAEGRLIEREQVDLELAARAAVLETELKGAIQMNAGNLIGLVDGNIQKAGDFIDEFMAVLDTAMNQFATTKEFQVIFAINKEQ